MGVSMLPRFAATVIMTTVKIEASAMPSMRRTSRANGTKAMRETSLVTSMLARKGSRTSPITTLVPECRRATSARPAAWKTPARESPAIVAMRQKSSPSVRTST